MNQLVPVTRVPLTRTPRRVRLRVADYLALDAAEAFAAYGRTELLDGEVVYMNAQHRPHARAKLALYDLLRDALRAGGSPLSVLVETSVHLGEHDAPEPDLTLTSEPGGPGLIPAETVALVIEVADTTLRSDLKRKGGIYARQRVPEYWVIDLNGAVIHQLWQPDGSEFAQRRVVAFGEPITAATISSLTVATDTL